MSDVEALAAACAGGHLDKVEALLAKGSRPGPPPTRPKKFGFPEASVRYPLPGAFPEGGARLRSGDRP